MQDAGKGSWNTKPFWCHSWRPKRYYRVLKMWMAPEFPSPPLGNCVYLQFFLCYVHPQRKAVMEVWSSWSFSWITEHKEELIKQTNQSSQTEPIQLIFESKLGNVLIWKHGQILISQGRNYFFSQLILRNRMDFKFHHWF